MCWREQGTGNVELDNVDAECYELPELHEFFKAVRRDVAESLYNLLVG